MLSTHSAMWGESFNSYSYLIQPLYPHILNEGVLLVISTERWQGSQLLAFQYCYPDSNPEQGTSFFKH